jgi:hypothetical protein
MPQRPARYETLRAFLVESRKTKCRLILWRGIASIFRFGNALHAGVT